MKWKGHLPLHRAKLVSLACATLTEASKGKGFLKETLRAKGPGKDALLNALTCSKQLCKKLAAKQFYDSKTASCRQLMGAFTACQTVPARWADAMSGNCHESCLYHSG